MEKTSLNVKFFDWDYLHLTALMKETYFNNIAILKILSSGNIVFSNKTCIWRLCKIILPTSLIWGKTVPLLNKPWLDLKGTYGVNHRGLNRGIKSETFTLTFFYKVKLNIIKMYQYSQLYSILNSCTSRQCKSVGNIIPTPHSRIKATI